MSGQPTAEVAKSQWISNFHIVLPDQERRRVLLLPSDGEWTLPFLRVEGGIWVGNSHPIILVLRERLGLECDFTILRYLRMEVSEEERWDRVFLVLELHERLATPPLGGRWMERAALAEAPLTDEGIRGLLLDYLDGEAAGRIPPLRAPWAQPGWFAEAGRWMTETLTGLGRVPSGAVQQFRNLGISSLLRVPTAAGLVYCKATAKLPLFVNEAVLMGLLAERFPGQIPMPLAIEPEKGWILLDDFGADLREEKAPERDVQSLLRQFGSMQIQSARMVEELLGLGCIDRRLPVLARQIDLLVGHSLTARHAKPDDLAQLRVLAPRLQERCAQLESYGLPDTLVHGDLHMGNAARNDQRYYIFDWSDPCVAHPLMDMITPYFFHEDLDGQTRLRDGYLSQWTEWEPMDRLREAWRLAKPLAALHQAVSYLHILLGQEELIHEEMADGLREFIAHAVGAFLEADASTTEKG